MYIALNQVRLTRDYLFVSAGSAAAWSAVQVHDHRLLREDQGGIQLSTGAVSSVSIERSYRKRGTYVVALGKKVREYDTFLFTRAEFSLSILFSFYFPTRKRA